MNEPDRGDPTCSVMGPDEKSYFYAVRRRLLLFRISVLMLTGLSVSSCSKKEEPYSAPSVQIYLPAENTLYDIGDTVPIEALITDQELVISVSVTLKNDNNQPVINLATNYPGSSTFRLKDQLVLGRNDLNGKYYIDVRAKNNENYKSAYRYIRIGGAPQKTEQVFLLSNDGSQTAVFRQDSSSWNLVTTFSGDFLASGVNQKSRQLICLGKSSGKLNAFDIDGNSLAWSYYPGALPGEPIFYDLLIKEDICYISYLPGRVLGFLPTGELYFQILLDNGFKPGKIYYHSKKFIYEEVNQTSGNVKLKVTHHPSGLADKELTFTFGRVQSFFEKSEQELLVFSQEPGSQYLSVFNFITNELTLLETDHKGTYDLTCRTGENSVAVFKDGSLSTYYINQRVTDPLIKSLNTDAMNFDQTSAVIWAADQTTISIIDPTSKQIISKMETGKTIRAIELMYGR